MCRLAYIYHVCPTRGCGRVTRTSSNPEVITFCSYAMHFTLTPWSCDRRRGYERRTAPSGELCRHCTEEFARIQELRREMEWYAERHHAPPRYEPGQRPPSYRESGVEQSEQTTTAPARRASSRGWRDLWRSQISRHAESHTQGAPRLAPTSSSVRHPDAESLSVRLTGHSYRYVPRVVPHASSTRQPEVPPRVSSRQTSSSTRAPSGDTRTVADRRGSSHHSSRTAGQAASGASGQRRPSNHIAPLRHTSSRSISSRSSSGRRGDDSYYLGTFLF